MPLPILYRELSKRQRAAYPHIIRGVREGLTQRAIETALRGMDLGIRHEVMRGIINQERSRQQYGRSLDLLSPSRMPVARNLPEAMTRLTRRYAFTFEVKGTLIATGQPVTHHITLSMDRLLSIGEMRDRARDLVGSKRDRYGAEVDSVTITGGMREGEEGTL